MPKVQSGEVITYVTKQLKLQPSEGLPLKVSDTIQPTIEVTRRYSNLNRSVLNTANGQTIYAIPAGWSLYVTSLSVCNSQDAACDCADIFISATTEDGVGTQLVRMPVDIGAINSHRISVSFPIAVRCKSGTSVSLGCTKTAGTHSVGATITGHLAEDVK